MKEQKGFTVIELFVVIVIIGIFAATIVPGLMGWIGTSGSKKEACEVSMNDYISTLYPELSDVRYTCSTKDSDFNGYVRCTGTGTKTDENFNTERITIMAECDSKGNCVPIQGVK